MPAAGFPAPVPPATPVFTTSEGWNVSIKVIEPIAAFTLPIPHLQATISIPPMLPQRNVKPLTVALDWFSMWLRSKANSLSMATMIAIFMRNRGIYGDEKPPDTRLGAAGGMGYGFRVFISRIFLR